MDDSNEVTVEDIKNICVQAKNMGTMPNYNDNRLTKLEDEDDIELILHVDYKYNDNKKEDGYLKVFKIKIDDSEVDRFDINHVMASEVQFKGDYKTVIDWTLAFSRSMSKKFAEEFDKTEEVINKKGTHVQKAEEN